MSDSIERAITRRINERIERDQRARRDRYRRHSVETRPVTAEHLATAFKDASARTLLSRARHARLEQDSVLSSYDASVYQRISAGLAFTKLGRDRLIFRTEHSARVRWSRNAGTWIDVTGARTALPGIPEIGAREAQEGLAGEARNIVPIPYYPGYEPLWAGTVLVDPRINENGPIHPLAEGSEAYYTYATGDSLSIRLPDGRIVRLGSLVVRPREQKWNVIVGTLWFDVESAQLVRAAYRFAAPMEIDAFVLEQDPTAFDDVPAWLKPLMFPMRGEVSAITVEYGMYGGRFWLPRMRSAEGSGQASFARVPFKIEQSFKYASVNARDSLPELPPLRRSFRRCDNTDHRVIDVDRYRDTRIATTVRIPCDINSLETSPDLPPSIYDPGEQLFDFAARDALIKEALTLTAQPPLTLNPKELPKPTLAYGVQLMRYNRVEGFSAGVGLTEKLGGGYTADFVGRIGVADLRPNAELTLTRSNLTRSLYVSGYTHLVSARDWGNPLSFSSSASALLFGRDEGFYYRAAGAEFGGRREYGTPLDWKLFVEQQRTADIETDFSLLGNNATPNITANKGTYYGGALRFKPGYGENPNGFRLFTDLRLEAGRGLDSTYGRGALDISLTKAFGSVASALTLSGGSSVGTLPSQRRWYLGGAHTIRGQSPDTALSGSAYWMTRAELGRTIYGPRAVVFGDLGWVGDRAHLDQVGRPLSGAGAGLSILDGLIRFDVARGINARKQWRVDVYIEAVF
jgi:hypothetical protein